MTELIKDNGLIAKAEKHYSFYVTERKEPLPPEQLDEWIQSKNKSHQVKSKHMCVRRSFDKDTGLGQTMYRTTGSFYVVKEYRIFVIVFLHSVKFDIIDPGSFSY